MNLDEAEEFLSTRVGTRRTTFSLGSYLFGPQRAFVEDASTFATALCTRRAGKSVGVGAWLLEGPLKGGGPSLYFTGTRKDAKRIMWPILLRINREQGLGYESNESDLCLKLNGEPMVFLMGVNTRDEIDKARGTGWGRVAGDEAQMLPQYVHEMVNDVLMPSFMDHGGKLRLIGTPGAMPSGFFHAALQNPAWAHHSWSVWDNPHLPNARAMLAEALKARGVTEDDPSIQREWFGRWVLDLDSLVFKFDAARNTFASLPALRGEWQYVVGIDLGYDDADAIAVLAFHDLSPAVYLVEEQVNRKETISELAARLDGVVSRYSPQAMVVDTGSLGRKITEELTRRFMLPLRAAEKTRKLEYISLLNDAMRTGRFFARADSTFVSDTRLVEWDRDKSTSDKLVVSDRFHSDVGDAVLYAFRESRHWLHEARPDLPPPGTAEAYRAEAERMENSEVEEYKERQQANEDSGWEDGWR